MDVSAFYDALAPWYHLIFADWRRSIERQAGILGGIIAAHIGPPPLRIWDAAAGIGTQAIGLARAGHAVTASDIARLAIRRAGTEARSRATHLTLLVADMQRPPLAPGSLDAVVVCDNALPHLLSRAAIAAALKEWLGCVRPGGGVLISMRDYGDAPPAGTVQEHDYGVREYEGRSYEVRQHWTWEAGRRYVMRLVIREPESGAEIVAARTHYFAIPPDEVCTLAAASGFSHVERVESDFYQPLILARRADA